MSARRSRRCSIVCSLLLALVGAFLGATAGTASAQTLPPYSAERTAFFNLGARVDLVDFGTLPLSDPRFGSILVSASGNPSPTLEAQASIGPNVEPSIFGRGSALLTYAFQVAGPQGDVPVQVAVHGFGSGSANAGASFAVESFWSLFTDVFNPLAGDHIRSGQIFGSGFDEGFDHTVELTLVANRTYTVSMLADAQAAATDAGSRSNAHAFVDPVFTFGAGVDPALYSFQFSTGIGNSAAVPEPSSAIAMLVGLLLLSARRRGGGQHA